MRGKSVSENPFTHLAESPPITALLDPGNLSTLSVEQFASRMNAVLFGLTEKYAIDPKHLRPVAKKTIKHFINDFSTHGHCTIIMRHGEQVVDPELSEYDAARKKIIMMQDDHNNNDSITLSSALEFCATFLTFAYIRSKTAARITIESSPNPRAAHPARLMADALACDLEFKESWRCVNYPSDERFEEHGLFRYLNHGTLPWEKEAVDAVVGEGTFDRILTDMQRIFEHPVTSGQIRIIITHTQQTNAVCQLSGMEPVRLNNYGYIAISDKATLHPSGFYLPEQTLQRLIQSRNPSFFRLGTEENDGNKQSDFTARHGK
ncbi:hypothetical protein [Legionella spiritensis]|uniref:Phosphoglycerate mutase n=1 Tax=Legionella spiritensis TaxID=452 RepID=A0A0W0YWZ6_LEGSP|nr:hypothetical protein [Legionella spiritensis]KTD61445.1 hypothetical protein Lspi_2687 [Legionella spiritensis]SNV33893.1 Uncharacterised protein [Legionella spiritensis]